MSRQLRSRPNVSAPSNDGVSGAPPGETRVVVAGRPGDAVSKMRVQVSGSSEGSYVDAWRSFADAAVRKRENVNRPKVQTKPESANQA